jgi:hypothetical protein
MEQNSNMKITKCGQTSTQPQDEIVAESHTQSITKVTSFKQDQATVCNQEPQGKAHEVETKSFIEWYGSCDIQYNARYGVGNMQYAYEAGQHSMQPQLTRLQDTIANLRLQLEEITGRWVNCSDEQPKERGIYLVFMRQSDGVGVDTIALYSGVADYWNVGSVARVLQWWKQKIPPMPKQ